MVKKEKKGQIKVVLLGHILTGLKLRGGEKNRRDQLII